MGMTEKSLTEVQALCDQAWAEIGELEEVIKPIATVLNDVPELIGLPIYHAVLISRCLNLVAGELIIRRCRAENAECELKDN